MPIDGYGTTLTIGAPPDRARREHWLVDTEGDEMVCRRCRRRFHRSVRAYVATHDPAYDCAPWPAWSLHVVDPAMEVALDAAPNDGNMRAVFADRIEEAGFVPQAAALRWLGNNGKYPNQFTDGRYGSWGAWGAYVESRNDGLVPLPNFSPHVLYMPASETERGWRYARTRQEAEDAMIELITPWVPTWVK